MMKVLAAAAVLSIGLGVNIASANCSDREVANCGDFKVISTACPKMDEKTGKLVGVQQNYYIAHDKEQRSIPVARIPSPIEADVYQATLNSETDLYVSVGSHIGTKRNLVPLYQTYTIQWGKKSDVTTCQNIDE